MELNEYQKFQLHHTGIKTFAKAAVEIMLRNFNCTIQELKPKEQRDDRIDDYKFQLHHTGIKTGFADEI